MSLSIGIVGFPNVGKSTLFTAITKKQAECANYPFCTIDPNVGIVSVPDERLDSLEEVFKSKKKIYSTIEFTDIAGIVEGASKGEGLGNKFLANIREADVIVYVLRVFKNENIISVRNEVNPLKESELLDTELMLKDLETLDKRIKTLEKDVRSLKKEAIFEMEILKKAKQLLENGIILYFGDFSDEEKKILNLYRFLTIKPRIYILNGKDEEIAPQILSEFEKTKVSFITMNLQEECDIADFSKKERIELGLSENSKMDILIRKAYELLGLITFFTAGPEEVRAWKIKLNSTAPEAAEEIHTDFKKHFIKADVIKWKDLITLGSMSEAKKKGIVRTEGKEYIVQDGDVIEIKHNS